MIIVYLLLAIIPTILIGFFLYKKDHNKEPKGLLIKLFFLGVASCFLTVFITQVLKLIIPNIVPGEGYLNSSLFFLFFQVMIGIALVEEFSKWIFTYFFGYRSLEFDEIYDAIIYCAFVSLGFATFENILYVLSMENQLATALLRAITAVPSHVGDAIIMGYFLGLAKKGHMNGYKYKKYLVLSIIVPMLAHGVYDFLIMSNEVLLIVIWVVFVIIFYVYAIRKIVMISKSKERVLNTNRCPICNNYANGNYCPYCGYNLYNNHKCVCGHYVNTNYCPHCGRRQE